MIVKNTGIIGFVLEKNTNCPWLAMRRWWPLLITNCLLLAMRRWRPLLITNCRLLAMWQPLLIINCRLLAMRRPLLITNCRLLGMRWRRPLLITTFMYIYILVGSLLFKDANCVIMAHGVFSRQEAVCSERPPASPAFWLSCLYNTRLGLKAQFGNLATSGHFIVPIRPGRASIEIIFRLSKVSKCNSM